MAVKCRRTHQPTMPACPHHHITRWPSFGPQLGPPAWSLAFGASSQSTRHAIPKPYSRRQAIRHICAQDCGSEETGQASKPAKPAKQASQADQPVNQCNQRRTSTSAGSEWSQVNLTSSGGNQIGHHARSARREMNASAKMPGCNIQVASIRQGTDVRITVEGTRP